MNKFMLSITASSGEFYQGDCEDLTLPISDGIYGVQAGHNPVLVALHMGILHFVVDGKARDVLVGDGIAEVTPAYVMVLVDSAETRRTSTRTVPRLPASAPRNACSISRACTNITRARSRWTVPCSVCRLLQSISAEAESLFPYNKTSPCRITAWGGFFLSVSDAKIVSQGHFLESSCVLPRLMPAHPPGVKAAMPEGTSSPARRCS